jgi:lactate permease
VDPVITVSANASGGVTGKMISPQSIAIGAAAVGLVGKESDLFRFTVKHSFIMLFIISLLTGAQAYVIPWIVPAYQKLEAAVATETANISTGFFYLLILALILAIVAVTVLIVNKRKIETS